MAYDLRVFDQEKTLDFLATINKDGSPHITVLSSVMAKDNRTLMFGQYCQGLSKENLLRDPRAGILAIGPGGGMARGRLHWTGRKAAGEEHELFNNIPRFRYNAVYGYAYVHLLEILAFETMEPLTPLQLEERQQATRRAVEALAPRDHEAVLPPVAGSLFPAASTHKVLGYIGEHGEPRLAHIPQAAVQRHNRVVIGGEPGDSQLAALAEGTRVAVLSYLPRLGAGIHLEGTLGHRAHACFVEIERVYNPNMPAAGYIYPMPPLEPVRVFEGAPDV